MITWILMTAKGWTSNTWIATVSHGQRHREVAIVTERADGWTWTVMFQRPRGQHIESGSGLHTAEDAKMAAERFLRSVRLVSA